MIRHSQNSNLTLYRQPHFQGLSVQTDRGPLVERYLERVNQVIDQSLQQYSRVFAFRIDLRLPSSQHFLHTESNEVLERFFASFKAKIRHNRNKAQAERQYAHDTTVRYLWCREFGQHGVPHYHLAILLNNDAFCTLGSFEIGRDNLFNRILEAWASALGIAVEEAFVLVHLPENPFYLLLRGDREVINDFFFRASYLCKADTKSYGDGVHGFGASRY